LDVIFSNVVLSAFEQKMAGTPGREFRLAQILMGLEDLYDYLIIDCPPSIGLLTFNALIASDEAMIPVDSSPFSLNGLGKLLDTVQLIEKKVGHELTIRVLATNVDRRTNFGSFLVETLKSRFPKNCLKTFINSCTRLREAAYHGKPITEYDRHCAAFQDYHDLTAEIIRQEAKIRRSRPKKKRIAFMLEAPENASVQIAGDFNNWVPMGLHLIEDKGKKVWQTDIPLMPGTYEYKYVVDGNWMPDPHNDKTVKGTFGGVNSVIIV
jgi:septum formation inhibitor-activating ATPase MinD